MAIKNGIIYLLENKDTKKCHISHYITMFINATIINNS